MNPKRPRTEKQAAASRANGAKSPGPKTEEGKTISSLNCKKGRVWKMSMYKHWRIEQFKTMSWMKQNRKCSERLRPIGPCTPNCERRIWASMWPYFKAKLSIPTRNF